jgi:hypothetical protein
MPVLGRNDIQAAPMQEGWQCETAAAVAVVPSGLYKGAARWSCLRTGVCCLDDEVRLSIAVVAVSLILVATSLQLQTQLLSKDILCC